MEKSNEKLRYILKYYYDKGEDAAPAYEKVDAVNGDGTLLKCAERKQFGRFRSGNFNLKDVSRSGRPIIEKADEVVENVQQDRHNGSVDIGMELDIDHKIVSNHLRKAGYKKKLDIWEMSAMSHFQLVRQLILKSTLDK